MVASLVKKPVKSTLVLLGGVYRLSARDPAWAKSDDYNLKYID